LKKKFLIQLQLRVLSILCTKKWSRAAEISTVSIPANDYIAEFRNSESKIQSHEICPLTVSFGYVNVTFNKTGLSVERISEPAKETGDEWKLLTKIKTEIEKAEQSNTKEQFCRQAAKNFVLLAATDYASTSVFDQSNTISGNEMMIKPEVRTNQLASTLEALELIQNECNLPEALILRSQLLIFQRFDMVPMDNFEKDRLPCIQESCIEPDEMIEFVRFIKFNTSIMLIFTVVNYLIPFVLQHKATNHEPLEIDGKFTKKQASKILKPTLTGIFILLELAILSVPTQVYESLVC